MLVENISDEILERCLPNPVESSTIRSLGGYRGFGVRGLGVMKDVGLGFRGVSPLRC